MVAGSVYPSILQYIVIFIVKLPSFAVLLRSIIVGSLSILVFTDTTGRDNSTTALSDL